MKVVLIARVLRSWRMYSMSTGGLKIVKIDDFSRWRWESKIIILQKTTRFRRSDHQYLSKLSTLPNYIWKQSSKEVYAFKYWYFL